MLEASALFSLAPRLELPLALTTNEVAVVLAFILLLWAAAAMALAFGVRAMFEEPDGQHGQR